MNAKRTSNSLKTQGGLVSIELALGFFSFWLICILWIEMSYVSYVSAMGDIMISHASSQAKRGEDVDFQEAFEAALQQTDSLWESFVGDGTGFVPCIYYVQNYAELKTLDDETDICDQAEVDPDLVYPIAIYQVNYGYKPIFTNFGGSGDTFSREMIVIQESQLE